MPSVGRLPSFPLYFLSPWRRMICLPFLYLYRSRILYELQRNLCRFLQCVDNSPFLSATEQYSMIQMHWGSFNHSPSEVVSGFVLMWRKLLRTGTHRYCVDLSLHFWVIRAAAGFFSWEISTVGLSLLSLLLAIDLILCSLAGICNCPC